MISIGVLSIQGSVIEHINMLSKIEGVKPVEVKSQDTLKKIDGLIIPGGESTTIGKLLNEYGLLSLIRERIIGGLPVWGTCAGMILLANRIEGQRESYLNVLDVSVVRNGYGSQLDSFFTTASIASVSSDPIPMTFIRAPYITEVGKDVKVLLELQGRIVAVEQDNILGTSFHPELTEDLSFHRYFISKTRTL